MAAYERQVRQAKQLEEIKQSASTLSSMLTVHQHDFMPATSRPLPHRPK
jgi:hypothetical protein